MHQEEGIILILAIALLSICYFSPITGFENFENFANITDSIKPKGVTDLIKPDGVIDLIKPDGVIVGGYVPQIIRPFDSVTAYTSKKDCNWPCYSDLKHQKWCSEKDAINYHAMRPLITSETYNENLKKMFELIKDKTDSIQLSKDEYTAVFCTETKNNIMSWLMQKIAVAVSKMPEMQKNSSWGTERFYELDTQLYQLIDEKGGIYFKVVFNLFNPLRSTSTLIYAVINVVNDKLQLKEIDFVNENQKTEIQSENIGTTEKYGTIFNYEDSLDSDNFDWNYQNTLEVQKFNKYGFHSNYPDENIKIEGGIPDSLINKIKKCSEDMACYTPAFTGFNEKGPVSVDGNVKYVYDNPQIVYSPTRDAKIEGIYNS